METTNDHCIEIYWKGILAEPVNGPYAFTSVPDIEIREQLCDLYCIADAQFTILKDDGIFVPGEQDLDLVLVLADCPDFQQEFPNTLSEFIACHRDDIVLVAGYNQ